MPDAALSNRPATHPLQSAQAASDLRDWPQVLALLQGLINGGGFDPTDEVTLQSTVDLALDLLVEGEFQERWEGAKVLAKLGDRAIEGLIDLVQDSEIDPDARWFGIRVLTEFQSPQIIPLLIALLQDSQDPDLQTMAVNSLGQMGQAVLPHLDSLYGQPQTRRLAAQVLSLVRHSQTIPPLLALAQDSQAETRAIAIEALGSFHSPQIAQTLLNALQDKASIVRSAAVKGIGFCAQELQAVDWVGAIVPMLNDLNLDTCRHSALTLSRIATPESALALHRALTQPHLPESLGLEFIRALGWIEHPTALNLLMDAIQNANLTKRLRQEACNLLGRRQQARLHSSQLLQVYLPDSPPELRASLVTALGQLAEPSAIAPLVALIPTADGHLRLHIIAALRSIDPLLAQQALQAATNADPTHPGLQQALKEWG
ncbi:MAG: HEAT repeat domain-containing protein [Alkalinema sp. RU_4_3]|nr:HEAT repeat domain-containing protein [Alkalinema sp. RU_4_3]